MIDIEHELRTALHDMAGEYAPPGAARPVVRRARRRSSLTAAVSAVTVVALVAGAVVGVQAYRADHPPRLIVPPPPSATPGGTPNGPIAFTGRILGLLRPDGSTVAVSKPGAFTGVTWSPDGTEIAFARGSEGQGEIVATPLVAPAERRVTAFHDPKYPAWSPDGSKIAFVTGEGDIYLVGVDGRGLREVTVSGDQCADLYPAWSPDSAQIAYYQNCYNGGHSGIYITQAIRPLFGGIQYVLGPLPKSGPATSVIGLSWSPDGSTIAFTVPREGVSLMSREGSLVAARLGCPSFPPKACGGFASPSWSPDGTRIAFVRDAGIWSMDDRGGHLKLLLTNSFGAGILSWGPAATTATPSPTPGSAAVGDVQYRFDAGHTGMDPYGAGIDASNVATLKPQTTLTPLILANQLPIAAAGSFSSLGTDMPGSVALAFAEGRLYSANLTTSGTSVTAEDTTTTPWRRLWNVDLRGRVPTPPVVAGGSVFVGLSPHRIEALDAATGHVRWSRYLAEPTVLTPAFAGGMVFVEAGRRFGTPSRFLHVRLYAIDTTSGHVVWTDPLNGALGPPVAVDGMVFTTQSLGSSLTAVDQATGEVRWAFDNPNFVSDPAVANGLVYFGLGLRHHEILALEEQTGALRWRTAVPEKIGRAAPVVSGSLLFTVSEPQGGFLHAFDANTGRLLWTAKAPGAQSVFPANGKLYVISQGSARTYAPA